MRSHIIYGIIAAAVLVGACSSPKEETAPEIPAPGETYLRQLQPRDSVLIADQLRYGFRLEGVEDGPVTLLPEKPSCPGIRFIGDEPWQVDTLSGSVDAFLTLTSFDAGSYELPPLGAVIGGDTLLFEGKTVEFVNCAVDTTKFTPENLHIPPTGIVRFPWTKAEKQRVAFWIAFGLIIISLIVFGIIHLARRRRKAEAAALPEPPHIRALRKIDSFRNDSYWKPERQKAFYSGITDALKEYIGSRYGFDAPEMTSGEVLHHLKKQTDVDRELLSGLGHLFEVADYVKFARHSADDGENAGVVPFATGFVTRTWQQKLEAEAAQMKKTEEAGQ